jgi:uncharacterized protein (DUF2252 family)
MIYKTLHRKLKIEQTIIGQTHFWHAHHKIWFIFYGINEKLTTVKSHQKFLIKVIVVSPHAYKVAMPYPNVEFAVKAVNRGR